MKKLRVYDPALLFLALETVPSPLQKGNPAATEHRITKAMKKINVAIVSTSNRLKQTELTEVAAALNTQVQEHFGPLWNIRAEVHAFNSPKEVPPDYWPVTVRDSIGDGMMSYHALRGKQPFVEVAYGGYWTLGASHDLLEMLVDPKLNNIVEAPSIVPGQKRNVKFPVQICDPCASPNNGYRINGVLVSDFSTPGFWNNKSPSKGKYSYTGSLTRPFQIVRGGYISWLDPKTNQWEQASWWRKKLEYQGRIYGEAKDEPGGSIRQQIAGGVRFRMVVLQEVYDAQEVSRLKIQTDIEKLIQRFG